MIIAMNRMIFECNKIALYINYLNLYYIILYYIFIVVVGLIG
ncbi:hypothetical protein XBKB1_4060009 [Xenorhabdus bovienii str. kraussei Becker Underwood]|uniref:Uncharacterized protein n=1 Tax=Xenorhabdus bovienii str. kraussei Becker Underwood TaxID=1398204 RepID=A0A077PMA6_XENBV|nr:hypothetical protein XBKB1_4060009 [Xenorhabdus bovienii str. kraussei Becker Underwood]